MWSRRPAEGKTDHRNVKERELRRSDFEGGMILGARWAGLSVSETADLLGCSCTTTWFTKRENKERISSNQCGQKFLVDVRGEWADWLDMIER